MKKVLMLMLAISMIGCGKLEKTYDKYNYESLSNERGTIHVYSGGAEIATYENVKITYSSADTQAMFITLSNGEKKYVQGDVIIDLN